ncbi:hypothetical protein [Chamaesiphon sp. VAR_48_metabat_403]|uniref:hypothetical protein n=1 Tax=Chamaesiphon sp. VAR_48_metabat_403 TaxID=2964700 RepID=UPI00286E9D66|nr:hypothetical protein [Chamaesiphon sp. VAR_48_metabat_403]
MSYQNISKFAVIYFAPLIALSIGFVDFANAAQTDRSILQATTSTSNANKINLRIKDPVLLSEVDTSDEDTSVDREQSMRYVHLGVNAQKMYQKTQKQRHFKQALYYYIEAIKTDKKNPFAYMGVGTLLGKTEEGILALKAAAILFYAEDNDEFYQLAIQYLNTLGISFAATE